MSEIHHRARLTEENVREIRSKYLAYVRGYGYFASRFNVIWETVRDVVQYKTWRHVI